MNPSFVNPTGLPATPLTPNAYQTMAFVQNPNPQIANMMQNPLYLAQLQINSMQPGQTQQPQIQIQQAMPMPVQTQMQPDAQQNVIAAALADPLVQAWISGSMKYEAIRLYLTKLGSENDDNILINALHACKGSNRTYREAIESLHGVNGHASNLWKDYYLDHKFRIDDAVARLPNGQPKTAKKPTHFNATASSSYSGQTGLKQPKKERVGPAHESSSASAPLPSRHVSFDSPQSARRTMNSQSTPLPDTSIPDPPSRAPTPPTRIVPGVKGNLYTEEDKKYFIDFVNWELHCDPTLTKTALLHAVAQKVPHHTRGSWASQWNRVPLLDNILARAKGEGYAEALHSSRTEYAPNPEGEDEDEGDDGGEEEDRDDDEDYEDEDGSKHASGDEDGYSSGGSNGEMGRAGEGFTKADFHAMAKWVARHPFWGDMTAKLRWYPFYENHPQRSDKSWAEAYRRNEKVILKMAAKYEEREKRRRLPHGRPSWANGDGRSPKKRKSSDR